VIQYTKAAGVMYAQKGIRFNCVVPVRPRPRGRDNKLIDVG
jgi:hypothetical protein